MQTTRWACLSPVSQHERFEQAVTSIFNHALKQQIFQEDSSKGAINLPKERGEVHLRDRASVRNSYFRTDGFGAENFSTLRDVVYSARDTSKRDTSRELQTCEIARYESRVSKQPEEAKLTIAPIRLVDNWSHNQRVQTPQKILMQEIESWRARITGVRSSQPALILGFDESWLQRTDDLFPDLWCALNLAFLSSDPQTDKYKVVCQQLHNLHMFGYVAKS
jgi:hypothetical protein